MNKNLAVFSLLFLLSFVSCGLFDKSRSKNPEVVVKKFLYYMNKHDYEKAKKYCNTKTQKILDFMDQLIAVSGQNLKTFDGNIEILKTEVNGVKAVCYCRSYGKEQKINLEKENGKWLIDMKKETPPKK